ncbi:MAG: hypothetical protein ACLQOO_36320, partial [Terriglobia bacterium]
MEVVITISGKDRRGRPFAENTTTIEISGRGARIATAHDLLLGSEISVENALGQTAAAKVLWRNETGVDRESNEFGIVLLTSAAAESLWCEPPSSGQPENAPPSKNPLSLDGFDQKQGADGTATPKTRSEGSQSAFAQATGQLARGTAEKPDPPLRSEEVSSAIQSLPGSPSTDRPSPALDEEIRPAEQGRPGLTSLAELGNDNHFEPVVQTSDAEATLIQPGTEACQDSPETQAPFRAVDVNIALKSIDLATDEALAKLQAASGTAESELMARTENYERRLNGLASQAIATVEEKSETIAESFRERALSLGLEMSERSSTELQKNGLTTVQTATDNLSGLTTGLIDEASGRISRAAQAASESLAQESKRISESQTRAMEVLKEQGQAISRTVADATATLAATRQQTEAALEAKVAEVSVTLKSIDSSAAEAVSRLRTAQEAIESSLTAKIEETERRLSGLASSVIAVAEEDSKTLAESLRERARNVGLEML